VFDGTPEELKHADTLTGAYLGARKQVGMGFKRRPVADATPRLILEGAREHNLQEPVGGVPAAAHGVRHRRQRLGQVHLIQDVLAPGAAAPLWQGHRKPGAHDRLLGADWLSDVVFVDQSPIGKTARSNPVSYVGAWDAIRELFATCAAGAPAQLHRGKFSFNSGDGRCPTCGGSGFEHVEMQFLSDVYLRCPDCDGKRYRPEMLEVTIERGRGRRAPPQALLNVADVLDLTVSEAARLFAARPRRDPRAAAHRGRGAGIREAGPAGAHAVGRRGAAPQAGGLSGRGRQGSHQSRQAWPRKGTLFLFDEPTTGLHFDDIAKLMRALRKLLDAGHSLIVIEHNLDVIRASTG
jgi:excinuclease ABC subunit A